MIVLLNWTDYCDDGSLMRFFKLCLSLIYFSGLGYLVFFARRRRSHDIQDVKIIPFRDTIRFYNTMNVADKKLVFGFYTNLFGNILLFIPLSVILISVCGVNASKKIMLYALLTSLTIEALQYWFEVGISDIDDVILNVIGAYIGIFVYKFFSKISNNFLKTT